jgi:GNAT superfamily N-acetyltransferase
MTGIDISNAPDELAKRSPKVIPALLLGRLAVDQRYAGMGVGTKLVAHVLATAVDLNTKAACRAVVVNVLNEGVRAWWQRFGFQPFDPADPKGLDLYLLASQIQATLEAIQPTR